MPPDDRIDAEPIKQILVAAWNRIRSECPGERVYAFGLYTNPLGQFVYPFLLGEDGLAEVAGNYVRNGSYSADEAPERLRWSTADSPYDARETEFHDFPGRRDVYELSETASTKETRYRLNAAAHALQELDREGLFGTGTAREGITLYIEGGDVPREWLLSWAKKLNPKSVYARFAAIDAPQDVVGTFVEFGNKKVYETKSYALSADETILAAVTHYELFVFDTRGPTQLFATKLPTKQDFEALGSVSMDRDGTSFAVIPFGGGKHGKSLFLVSGKKGATLKTVPLKKTPMAVAMSPTGEWIAVTDEAGVLNVFEPDGTLRVALTGHTQWPRGIASSADGSRIATADGATLIVRNSVDWSVRFTVDGLFDAIDFDASGRVLAACARYPARNVVAPNAVTLFDGETGSVIREIRVDGYRIERVRLSRDGALLACAMRRDVEEYSGTDVAAVVDARTGEVLDRLKADFEQIRDFAFLPERKEIAVAVFGHTRKPLVLWKACGL